MKNFFRLIRHKIGLTSYPVGERPNVAAELILKLKDLKVTRNTHYIVFSNKDYEIEVWDCNRWYSWFSIGKILKDGKLISYWDSCMLNAQNTVAMREFLEQKAPELMTQKSAFTADEILDM